MVIVILKGFEDFARLISNGEEGLVVKVQEKLFLSGKFSLELLQNPLKGSSDSVVSNTSSFNPSSEYAAEVEKVDVGAETYSLLALRGIPFSFSPVQVLRPHGDEGPYLKFDNLTVIKWRGNNSTLIAPDRVGISLLPVLPEVDVNWGEMMIPTESLPVGRVLMPATLQGTRMQGYFIEKGMDGEYVVKLGGFRDHVLFNHFSGVQIFLPGNNVDMAFTYKYCLDKLDKSAFTMKTGGYAEGAGIIVKKSSGLHLDLVSRDKESHFRTDQIEIWGSKIVSREIGVYLPEGGKRPLSSLTLALLNSDQTFDSHDFTGIVSSPNDLTFILPLRVPENSQSNIVPQFVYRDLKVDKGIDFDKYRQQERFNGLQVKGFFSGIGSAIRMDANFALLVLKGGSSSTPGKFHLKGGGTLESLEGVVSSKVVPKPDFNSFLTGNMLTAKRCLELVAGIMTVRIEVPLLSNNPSPILIDTEAQSRQVKFAETSLLSPPLGTSGYRTGADIGANGNLEYLPWIQTQKKDITLDFDLKDGIILPSDGKDWLGKFESGASEFSLAQHPGGQLILNPSISPLYFTGMGATGVGDRTVLTWGKGWSWEGSTGKETALYAGLSAVIIYVAVDWKGSYGDIFALSNKINIKLKKLTGQEVLKNVKANEPDNLVVVFYDDQDPSTEDKNLEEFINNNCTPDPTKNSEVVLPLDTGITLLLWKRDPSGQTGEYLTTIAKKRGLKPGLAINQSSKAIFDPGELGWGQKGKVNNGTWNEEMKSKWARIAGEDPELWPRGSGQLGARLDPSDPQWRGLLFREFPMTFALPKEFEEGMTRLPLLENLIKAIQSHLFLSYGWIDETGATWKAGIRPNPDGDLITPDSWKKVFKLSLVGFQSTGRSGKTLSLQGEVKAEFPLIRDDSEEKHLTVSGRFKLSMGTDKVLDFIEIVLPNSSNFATRSIPGFKEVRLHRFFTDFESAKFEIELIPDDQLAIALPFMGDGTPVKAIIGITFGNKADAFLDLVLPAELRTNLFGKWPTVVQGMRATFGPEENLVRARCRINLGLPAFSSVGGDVLLYKDKNSKDWKLDFLLNTLSGRLDVGEFEVEGKVNWGTREQQGSLPSTSLPDGRQRQLYGSLTLTNSGGLISLNGNSSKIIIYVRIGSEGETPFWMAGLSVDKLSFGHLGKIEDGFLFISKNADDYSGNIEGAVSDITKRTFTLIRPDKQNNQSVADFLEGWNYSSKVGTVVGLSGYLEMDKTTATSPKKDDDASKKYLTGILISNTGIARIEAVTKILNAYNLSFAIGIDIPKGILSAAVQLPAIEVKNGSGATEFLFSPGQMTFSLKYKNPIRYSQSMGWPPKEGNSEFERDWSKATTLYMANLTPVNTFQGGYFVAYDFGDNRLDLGIAARAGWTWKRTVGGGVIEATADFGVMLGGVFILSSRLDMSFFNNNEPKLLGQPYISDRSVQAREDRANLIEHLQSYLIPPTFTDLVRSRGLIADPKAYPFLNEEFTASQKMDVILAIQESRWMIAKNLDQMFSGLSILCVSAEIFVDVWAIANLKVLGITLAGFKIEGRARLRACGPDKGKLISKLEGQLYFEVQVKIGCINFTRGGSVTFTLLSGECPGCPEFLNFLNTPKTANS